MTSQLVVDGCKEIKDKTTVRTQKMLRKLRQRFHQLAQLILAALDLDGALPKKTET